MSQTELTNERDSVASRSKTIAEIDDVYARYADWIDRLAVLDRLKTGRYRRRQFGDVDGRVLDVACGTGTNFPYFRDRAEVVGVDVSPEMLAKARETLEELPITGDLHRMDAQSLAFPTDSFQTVVSALSTCTFPDPVAALDEMARVCRPGGRVLLLEHGRSDVAPLARYQEWRADAHFERSGCRLTQEPLEVVGASGLTVVETDTALLGTITTIEAVPPGGRSQ